MEAILLTFGSGLVGIVVGILPLPWLATIAECTVWDLVSPHIILISLSVAVAGGIFFGVYPAKKAANLDPIESLRYEQKKKGKDDYEKGKYAFGCDTYAS